MTEAHWPDVAEIFRQGIETGVASVQKDVPSWDAWNARHLESCRLVAILCNQVVGWAALSPVREGEFYRGLAETSVYVRKGLRNAGIGTALLRALAWEAEEAGIWTLVAYVLAENEAGRALHAKCGFREAATFERVGKLDGRWRDVVMYQRRSGSAGVDCNRENPGRTKA